MLCVACLRRIFIHPRAVGNKCCDIDEIPQSLVGWNDPYSSYDQYNLIFDVPWDGLKRTKIIKTNTRNTGLISEQDEITKTDGTRQRADRIIKTRPIYSTMRHYPPSWLKELMNQDDEPVGLDSKE